jgi:hypothetical protein
VISMPNNSINIKKHSLPIYLLLILIAAVWVVFDQHGVINNDGVLYLQQANLFAQGDASAAFALFPWPFYAYFIALVHKLTGLSLLYSGQLINIVLFVVACYFFLKNLFILSKDRTVLLAGFLAIMTSIPILDDYMPMLMRDNGMWAGFTSGLYFYLRWHKAPSLLNALLFQVCFVLGALFRPEIIILNLLIPIASFWVKSEDLTKARAFVMSGLFLWVSVFLGLIYLGYHAMSGDLANVNTGRLLELYDRPKAVLENLLSPLPMGITTDYHYLHVMIDDHALALKYLFITYVVAYKWVAVLGFFHLATAYIGIKRRLVPPQFIKPLLLVFVISFLITAVNLPTNYVLSRRYWVMNLWVVYLVSALGLGFVIRELFIGAWKRFWWAKIALVFLVLGYMAVVLFDSHRKNPDMEVVAWLKQHQVDVSKTYIDNKRVCFYMGSFDCESIGIDQAKQAAYPYLVLYFNRYQDAVEVDGYQVVKKVFDHDRPAFVVYQKQ